MKVKCFCKIGNKWRSRQENCQRLLKGETFEDGGKAYFLPTTTLPINPWGGSLPPGKSRVGKRTTAPSFLRACNDKNVKEK